MSPRDTNVGRPQAPRYDAGSLADVLPAVATSLGVPGLASRLTVPPARRAVVVLVDGMGHELVRRRAGHAPWLRSQLGDLRALASGFPSTTATSMGSFGTGRLPGAHGLVGYEVLVPGEDRLFNELSWEDGPAPEQWQPHETVFEAAQRAGVQVMRTGPGFFGGSGLTRAALRGGRFVAADSLEARVEATLQAVRAAPRSLVYLYWGDLDKIGHVYGCGSWEWGDELESVDRALQRLAAGLPSDTSLTVTADHGMVDVPAEHRLDVAAEPELAAGVRHVGGEPRAVQLWCEPGAAPDVLAAWSARLGEHAWVATREQAVAAGWFGRVEERVLPRIGEVIAAMRTDHSVVDSRRHRPELIRLIGVHGSLTADEVAVPLLHVAPTQGAR